MWRTRSMNLLLLLIFYVWSSSASGDVRPSEVNVNKGGGFLIRLLKDTDEVRLQSCSLTRNNEIFPLAPGQNQPFKLSTGELVHPFDYNNTDECGVRVFGVADYSLGPWKLSSVDGNGKEKSGSAEVQGVVYGECQDNRGNDCRFLSADNEFLKVCDYSIDARVSKCDFFADGGMSRQTVTLSGSAPVKKELSSPYFQTQAGSTVLDCSPQLSAATSVYACHVEHVPTKRKYFITEGLFEPRYSTYKTDFSAGICQFEIVGELNDDETGAWIISMQVRTRETHPIYTMEDNYTDETKTCKFHVKGNETLALEKIVLRTKSTVVVKTTAQTVTIQCAKSVFYPIRLCYLLNPEGSLTLPKDFKSFDDGTCEFEVSAGDWTCGFNGPVEGDADFVQNFEVIHYEEEIVDGRVRVAEDGSVTMECHLLYKDPIKMCMLVSPGGEVYRPTTDQFKSEKFSYYGGGSMNTGDCGIAFSKGQDISSDGWKCHIVKMNDEILTIGMFVQ